MVSISEIIGKLPYIGRSSAAKDTVAENPFLTPDKIIPAAFILAKNNPDLDYILYKDINMCVAIRDSGGSDYSSLSAGQVQAAVVFEYDSRFNDYKEFLLCMEPHKYPAGKGISGQVASMNAAYQKAISDVVDFSKMAFRLPYSVRMVRDDMNASFRSKAEERRWKYNRYSRGLEIPEDLDYFEIKRFQKKHELPRKARLFDAMAFYSEDIECPYWMPLEEYLKGIKQVHADENPMISRILGP